MMLEREGEEEEVTVLEIKGKEEVEVVEEEMDDEDLIVHKDTEDREVFELRVCHTFVMED